MMRKINVGVILIFSLFIISSIMTSAFATKGWVVEDTSNYHHHTAVNPGSKRICGDHICAPFEHYEVKNLSPKRENQTDHFIN